MAQFSIVFDSSRVVLLVFLSDIFFAILVKEHYSLLILKTISVLHFPQLYLNYPELSKLAPSSYHIRCILCLVLTMCRYLRCGVSGFPLAQNIEAERYNKRVRQGKDNARFIGYETIFWIKNIVKDGQLAKHYNRISIQQCKTIIGTSQ